MGREDKILERLSEIIRELDLEPGSRLPAERKLASQLEVSRNTLRNTLRMLEARGLVRIRMGSGTYLRTRLLTGMAQDALNLPHNPDKLLADQFEAAFMFLPVMATQCAVRIGERQLAELQQCNISLSRSLFAEEPEMVWSECLNFFHLMALGTGNEFVVRTVEQICSTDMSAHKLLSKIEREEREKIFAGHVKILHALRERNQEGVARLTEDYVLCLCRIIEEYEQVKMTDMLFKAMRGRERE
ncbi:MAG: FadR family transcriptional regulator [Pseudodesulfovibrio sp.]|nr:FadR family transcriptional regulator [Pseudodesulfovibrio sp.]